PDHVSFVVLLFKGLPLGREGLGVATVLWRVVLFRRVDLRRILLLRATVALGRGPVEFLELLLERVPHVGLEPLPRGLPELLEGIPELRNQLSWVKGPGDVELAGRSRLGLQSEIRLSAGGR